MIEREPITVILSQRGWIRAMKGHVDLASTETLKFKEGDGPAYAFHAQTTDKLLLADRRRPLLHAGRGQAARRARLRRTGAPDDRPRQRDRHRRAAAGEARRQAAAGRRATGAASSRRVAEILAETRKGRQVVNLKAGASLKIVRPLIDGADAVAVIGDNRKLVIFPLAEAAGNDARSRCYRSSAIGTAGSPMPSAWRWRRGCSWAMGGDSGRTRTETDLSPWRTRARCGAGGCRPMASRATIGSTRGRSTFHTEPIRTHVTWARQVPPRSGIPWFSVRLPWNGYAECMTARAKPSADDSAPMAARAVRRPAGQRIGMHPDAPAAAMPRFCGPFPIPPRLFIMPTGTIEILAGNEEFSQFFQEVEGAQPTVERRAIRQFDWRERAESMFQSHRPSDRFEIEFQGQVGARSTAVR